MSDWKHCDGPGCQHAEKETTDAFSWQDTGRPWYELGHAGELLAFHTKECLARWADVATLKADVARKPASAIPADVDLVQCLDHIVTAAGLARRAIDDESEGELRIAVDTIHGNANAAYQLVRHW